MTRIARPPTIHDVARQAGVSVGTVSHVLSGKAKVSEQRREQVLAAASEVGYRPNGLARGLRKKRSEVVGFSFPTTQSAFHASLTEALEEVAAQERHVLMQVMSRGNPDLELARIEALLARRVDGIIMVPSVEPERALDLIATSNIPAVIIGDLEAARFDAVTIDEAAAMEAAVRHLADLGHRRLAFLVRFPRLAVTRTRIHALERIVAASGGLIRASVMSFGNDQAQFERDFPASLTKPDRPTAVIASNSILASWALRSMHLHGIACPDDLSIIAFDEPVWGELLTPQLSIVRQPVASMARLAWDLLMARQDAADTAIRRLVLQTQIVSRGSTAAIGGCRAADGM